MLFFVLASAPVIITGCFGVISQMRVNSTPSETVKTEQRIATCQEAMRLYSKETNSNEGDRNQLVEQCQISQNERSLEQWECVLDKQKKGMKYTEAANACPKSALSPN